MAHFPGYIGRQAIRSVDHILNLFAFTHSIFKLIIERPRAGRALLRRFTLEQIYFTGFQALHIIIPVALIIGSMLIVQYTKVSAQYDLGKMMVFLLVRETGPIVTALIVILRTATAVTIETGYMHVLHEIETIEMTGLDPLRIICLPRIVGITSAILCLFVVFDLVSIMGGYAIVWAVTYIPMGNFLQQIAKAITATDIAVGFIKAICFGITITVTCLYHGFKTTKRITDIPASTSKAAIECFLYCLIVNVVISVLFYI
ncbi:MlaE family ABC transporter permease [Thermodesulfobacteriota bacterium]